MAQPIHILLDTPLPGIRRITLNRPEKRNALNNRLRAEIFAALEAHDRDEEVKVTIIRAAGPAFCAGYDLSANNRVEQPYHTAGGHGQWSRHVVDGWFRVWDLAKPVIAQVHGYCLAGGTEAVAKGWANRAFAAADLDTEVLKIAERVAKIPSDIQQINKRSVHRAMEIMGLRAAVRSGTEIQALAFHTDSSKAYMSRFRRDGESVSKLLSERDASFGDYRERKK